MAWGSQWRAIVLDISRASLAWSAVSSQMTVENESVRTGVQHATELEAARLGVPPNRGDYRPTRSNFLHVRWIQAVDATPRANGQSWQISSDIEICVRFGGN